MRGLLTSRFLLVYFGSGKICLPSVSDKFLIFLGMYGEFFGESSKSLEVNLKGCRGLIERLRNSILIVYPGSQGYRIALGKDFVKFRTVCVPVSNS